MENSLRVPQQEVDVRLQLVDGRSMDGVMYVPPVGPSGGAGHLIDRLNTAKGEFLPLTEGGKTHLVHASRIITVRIPDEEIEEDVAAERFGRHLLVAAHLVSGVRVIGKLSFLPEADHERLQDYLNVAPRFIPLHVDDDLVYVNRDQVVSVVALRGEDE